MPQKPCCSGMPTCRYQEITCNLLLLITGWRGFHVRHPQPGFRRRSYTDSCSQRNTPAFVHRATSNDRTDMVFSADFSVNRAGNELLLCFGIMAVLL